MAQKRKCGVLLPVSSLPSKYGIGCFDKKAYEFVDALKEAGQSYWQILPLGPTSYGDSPYQSFSTFAGNPYFISLEALIEEGVLTKKECDKVDFGTDATSVDYAKLYEGRMQLLRKAYERSNIYMDPEFRRFQEEEAWWLKDYALFMAVKKRFGGIPWSEWAEDIRLRWQNALDYYREEMYFEIEFQEYMQFKFRQQWMALKSYANEKGIQIIGDIPIYVSADSSDVWTHPKLFKLKPDLSPKLVAGVPPDYYSATGQLWGNPVYNWAAHKKTGYAWWIWRMKSNMALFDVVRLDHFRGFAAYWEVGADEETAINGKWRKGPGMELFNAIEKALGPVPLIAEDLGVQTDEVKELLEESGFPGMRVLIFGFTPDYDNEHLPHNYKPNSIVYTSTHDSQTVCEQIMDICTEPEKQFAYRYLRTSHAEAMGWSAIKCVWASSANIAMTTLQDLLSLGADARMNTPATIGGKNWRWRVRAEALNPTVAALLGDITKTYMRG